MTTPSILRVHAAVVVLFCAGGTALAQGGDEAAYERARSQYVRDLLSMEKRRENIGPANEAASRDLAARLRRVVGDFSAPFVTGPGDYSLAWIVGDPSSALLDGFLYQSPDKRISVLVTTRRQLTGWIPRFFEGGKRGPQDLATALRDEDVLTQIVDYDAHVFPYADIRLEDGTRLGVVAAVLASKSNDYCRCTPDRLFVSVVRGTRFFFLTAPASEEIGIPAVCSAQADSAAARQKILIDSSFRATPRDTALMEVVFGMQDETDKSLRRCYGEHVVRNPRFGAVVAQVRELVTSLPPR